MPSSKNRAKGELRENGEEDKEVDLSAEIDLIGPKVAWLLVDA